MRKMTAQFRLGDQDKDGVITMEDFDIVAERAIKLLPLNADQRCNIEKLCKLAWTVISPDGKAITLEMLIKGLVGYIEGIDSMPITCIVTVVLYIYFIYMYYTYRWPFGTYTASHYFDLIDFDADGYISIKEFTLFHQCYGVDAKFASATFATLDTDGDGNISRQEFVDAFIEYYNGTDENHPSAALFGPY